MQPFTVSEESKRLKNTYPPHELLAEVASKLSKVERQGLLRLWISEGIPYAFKDCPMVYEAVREWLGKCLDVHPKMITLIGSARIGYSLAPPPEYGRSFNPDSDLDFSIVSHYLFERFEQDFLKWEDEFSKGLIHPRNPKEKGYWENNVREVPNNIERGFIHGNRVPYMGRYPTAQLIGNTMDLLHKRLKVTVCAPQLKKEPSVRVFRDWSAFIRLREINLRRTLDLL